MVHGGLLAKRDNAKHMAEAAEHGIQMIDMVVVNLYAFEKTVESGADFGTCIENIDIGGPSMLRSAAKNFESVTVVTDPETYEGILAEMRANGGATTRETRMELALEVFETTNAYDGAIADFLFDQVQTAHPHEHGEGCGCGCEEGIEAQGEFPPECALYMQKQQDLRYGENPHQQAVFYRVDEFAHEHSLVNAQQLNGKELSVQQHPGHRRVLVARARARRAGDHHPCKHQNPCGSATADDHHRGLRQGLRLRPESAFGGIIAANRQVTLEMVEHINENKQFVEALIAPEFESAALELLQQKKNLRALRTGGIDAPAAVEVRSVDGGVLVQDVDHVSEDPATFTVPTDRKPTDAEMHELDVRMARVQGREVQRHPGVARPRRHRHGSGPAQPRGQRAAGL